MDNYADQYQDDSFEAEWETPSANNAIARVALVQPVRLTDEQYQALTSPVVTAEIMRAKYAMVEDFVREHAVKGVDYGTYYGIDRNIFTKPLAQKAVRYFGFRFKQSLQDSVFERDIVSYRYKVQLLKDDYVISEAERVAASSESCFCSWIRWTKPESVDEQNYMLGYKLAKEENGIWYARKPHPDPRSEALKVNARAQTRAEKACVALAIPIADVVALLPTVALTKPQIAPSGQQGERKQITQGDGQQQGAQQTGKIVKASPNAFYKLAEEKGIKADSRVKRLAAKAYSEADSFTWEEAMQTLQQF